MNNIHIGSIIKQKLEESSMSMKEFAGRIKCERTTVYNIFERKSIDSELLLRISQALNFDFYNEVYLNNEKNNFSKKILIAIEIDEKNIDKLDLPDNFTKLRETVDGTRFTVNGARE